jgi:serine protease Do
MWDLALLVPQTGKWQEGLTASGRDPVRQDASIKSFSAATKGKAASPAPMTLRGYRTLIGGDDKQLDQAIELGSRVMPNDLGSPIIDEEGRVIAVLGRGCAPNEGRPCTPVAFGIPISAIKGFLRSVPPTAVPPAAWLGIQGIAEAGGVAKGVRVMVVHPESPADEAQLKGGERGMGDMILAVDGVPVTSPEALADAIRTHAVGEKVPLTIFSQGKYKQVTVNLRAAPGPRSASAAPPAHPAELPALPEAPPGPPGGPRHR